MFAISYLSTPVYTAKRFKRNRKRKMRPKSESMRVNTGKDRWRELRVLKCIKMDAKLALLLLDR